MNILQCTKEMFELTLNKNSLKLINNYEINFIEFDTGFNIVIITDDDLSGFTNNFHNLNDIYVNFNNNINFIFKEKQAFFTYNTNILDIFVYR